MRILVSILLFAVTLNAGTNGTLEGTVSDKQSKELLPGATIKISGLNIGAVTDPNGYYTINNIPSGIYDVVVSYVGYSTLTIKDVRIKADLKTKIDIELSQSTVEISAVEVTAEKPPIQKDVTGTSYTSSEESFKSLPVTTVSDVIGLQPGVTLENNIRGGKTTEVVYLVDGLPIQNLIEGGSGSELPQSSIAEMHFPASLILSQNGAPIRIPSVFEPIRMICSAASRLITGMNSTSSPAVL